MLTIMYIGKFFIQLVMCLVFVEYHYLVPEITFCAYLGDCYMSIVSGSDVPSIYRSDHVASLVVIF